MLGSDSPPRQHKRSLSSDDIGDIITRYKSGAPTAQIGNQYRISKSRVSALLHAHGVKLRRQGLSEGQASEAADLYTAGRSLAWLAARYSISPTTVSRALHRQHIQLRPPSGRI